MRRLFHRRSPERMATSEARMPEARVVPAWVSGARVVRIVAEVPRVVPAAPRVVPGVLLRVTPSEMQTRREGDAGR